MTEACWSRALLDAVETALRACSNTPTGLDLRDPVGVHLAIFIEPYLDLIINGKKTIESRFGVQRCAPHGRVTPRDILLLKRSSGPVVGICRVKETWFFDLQRTTLNEVRTRFARQLCAEDPAFWLARANSTLATLIRVDHVTRIRPIAVKKRDRRGWVVLRDPTPLLGSARI